MSTNALIAAAFGSPAAQRLADRAQQLGRVPLPKPARSKTPMTFEERLKWQQDEEACQRHDDIREREAEIERQEEE